MKTIFTLRDKKAAAYSPIFVHPTIGLAEREISDLANDPQSTLSKHPDDYTLFAIGQYDDLQAQLKSYDQPQFIAEVTDLIRTK